MSNRFDLTDPNISSITSGITLHAANIEALRHIMPQLAPSGFSANLAGNAVSQGLGGRQ